MGMIPDVEWGRRYRVERSDAESERGEQLVMCFPCLTDGVEQTPNRVVVVNGTSMCVSHARIVDP